MTFSRAEMFLIWVYQGDTRLETLENLRGMMEHLTSAECELHELTASLLEKLGSITDDAFLALIKD